MAYRTKNAGRSSYLQTRSAKPLTERHRTPQTTAQEVGWNLEKNNKEHLLPRHGRKGIIKRDFFTPGTGNGIV